MGTLGITIAGYTYGKGRCNAVLYMCIPKGLWPVIKARFIRHMFYPRWVRFLSSFVFLFSTFPVSCSFSISYFSLSLSLYSISISISPLFVFRLLLVFFSFFLSTNRLSLIYYTYIYQINWTSIHRKRPLVLKFENFKTFLNKVFGK